MFVRGPVRLPLEQLQPFLFETSDTRVHWPSVFGNSNPVEMEVGFGKGLFLVTASHERPDVNFFGIDIERSCQLFAANRLAKRNITNVRLARTDAWAFLEKCVPPGSLQAIHVYFPDPWWKNRHRKRRLFTEPFARACAQALLVGGTLEVMSDVEDYFRVIARLLSKQPRLQPRPEMASDGDFRTSFERKYRLAGKPIFRAGYRASESPSSSN